MSLQPLFRRFHEAIQLKNFGENAELREKRDRVLKRLRDNLARTFEPFNQGSYAMGTGIKPINGDYDIDIGVVFDLDCETFDPVTVKGWVHEAVKSHTARVEWRRPCITVYYSEAGEPIYHIDLAVFRKDPVAVGGPLRLALGKQHSQQSERQWQPDGRQGFMELVKNRFSNSEDATQFRRVIRYLKRWKDVHFPSEGRWAPSGHALTVAAYHWFSPSIQGWGQGYDDLGATFGLVQNMLQHFRGVYADGAWSERLSLSSPVAPHDDVFARMTGEQMKQFKERLIKLSGWLTEARQTGSTAPLRRAFGTDFPEK